MMTPSRPTSTVPLDPPTPISTPSSFSPASTVRRQQQHHSSHERLAAPVPVLLEAMRTLLALPICDARMAAATFRATRYLFRAARGPQAARAVVETFDKLVCLCDVHILVRGRRSGHHTID